MWKSSLCLALLALARGEDLAQWTTAGWYVQVDGVMGGRSSGNLQLSASGADFQGTINLNGGGFSSYRRFFGGEKDLSGYSGVWVETDVVTDTPSKVPLGMHIQFEDSSRWSFGAAFAVPFGSVGETYSVYLPFEWFTKQLRWRCNGCVLDRQRITEMSVYVLYQEGPFKINVRQIRAVQSPSAQSGVPSLQLSTTAARELVWEAIQRGSTLWNKGNPEICGAVYMMTAQTLVASSVASHIQEVSRVAISMADIYPVNLGAEGAWILRKAFDHIIASYDGIPAPQDSNYPAVAHGTWAALAIEGVTLQSVPASGTSTTVAVATTNAGSGSPVQDSGARTTLPAMPGVPTTPEQQTSKGRTTWAWQSFAIVMALVAS